MVEAHPYHFADNKYKLASLANANPNPLSVKDANGGVPAADKHAVVINEYGYLWLNRDGTPTTLTEKFYLNLLGTNSTTVQRRQLYARYTAAETEFWRSHRQAAAVMHFTALGYSRPDGQTSDHWIDIKKLTWEPEFYRYVRDSFAPLGVMIDTWAEDYPPGKQQDFPVVIINDLESPWKGDVQLRILRDNKAVAAQTLPAEVAGFGTTHLTFTTTIPEQSGSYQVEATLPGPVRSLRDFTVLTQEQMGAPHKPR